MQNKTNANIIRLSAIGGFSRIGGSSALVQMDGVKILFDCGISSGLARDPVPPLLAGIKPDIVLVSHAHIDHVGALPIVVRNNPGVPVFTTSPTRKLAEIMLRDCMKLSSTFGPPIYSNQEIDKALDSSTGVSFDEPIHFKNLVITFRRAGHILGAATIIVDGGHRVVYTGDFSKAGTRVTPSPSFPNPSEKCDLMLSETTYGGRTLTPRQLEEDRMLAETKSTLQSGGRVLIPSFALGRAQEVIAFLATEMDHASVPRVPIYLDGMVKEITETYASLAEWLPDPSTARTLTDWKALRPIDSELERMTLLFGNEPCIIIASSGMLSGGWSVLYARDVCSRIDSAIFFVGYLDEESPGHKLRRMQEGEVRLLDEEVVVKCKIDSFALSAHANREGIIDLASRYSPTFYVPMHGDSKSRWSVAQDVSDLTKAVPLVPFESETFELDTQSRLSQPILSESDNLADRFLGIKERRSQNADDISVELWQFLEENGVTTHLEIERVLWSIFKLSANYVSTDPWLTINERARFFLGCMKVLSDHFPESAEVFIKKFHSTIPSFLANLILFGGNRSWQARLKTVKTASLEEAEALLLQTWKELGVYPTLMDVYQHCKIRSQEPLDSETETKFSEIFNGIEPIFSLLAPLPHWVRYLVVNSTLVAAVDEKVIFALRIVLERSTNDDMNAIDLTGLPETRLIRLAGWQLDGSRVTPSALLLDGPVDTPGIVTRANFDEWLSKAIQPFRRDIAPGTFFAASDLPKLMAEYGFQVKVQPGFIEARHIDSGNRILIGLAAEGSQFERYKAVRGAVVDFEKFKVITRRLSKLWKHKADVRRGDAELGTEVIVSYGWHSYLPTPIRRNALEDAMEVYQYSHIIHILRMLESYWGKQPSFEKYSTVAKQDREWLEQTYGFKRTAEIEGFNMDVRDFCGLSFAKAQYDRYLILIL